MAQVGRISGPLLFANLERNGIDLNFRDTLDTTPLLYLDVNTGKIGVNTETPDRELRVVSTTRTTDLIADTDFDNPDLKIATNVITAKVGDLRFSAAEAVVVSTLETDGYTINDNIIRTNDSNSNIDLVPSGTGRVDIDGNLQVYGDIDTPGNITFDGSIIFGDTLAQDTVDFNTEVNSDIIPDQSNTYSLGSASKRWNELYTNFVNGQSISTGELTVGFINYNLRQGNIFYVAVNGDDDNKGDHILSPFATIQRALQAADASTAGQVVIHVFPGEYQEQLPLIVPPFVSITGSDMRNVIITPDTSSQYEDVFHLSGDTTVSDITIKDFYYDSNVGYAFRFAEGATINGRFPYVQNVSVITQGSTTAESDPRGFESGDAGRGAYLDGAELDPSSTEAAMLFHSVTFITPGADGLTMTNGVRVEWLNSFTYFADRGLYMFNNSSGRTANDGSTTIFGAELRSIGSANVYGNYGAVADGSDCLMYLINHNFAYVGAGKAVDNDPTDAVQSQEVVETNGGEIVFTSIDHTGTYRVGDTFFVDFETGETSVDVDTLTASGLTRMVIADEEGNETIFDPTKVTTGNLRFEDNVFSSVAGDLNISAATNTINLSSDVAISDDLDISGNLSFDGNLNLLGNQATDTLVFNVDIEQDFVPHQNTEFFLGSASKEWKTVSANKADVADIQFYNNIITTNVSNADLELRAQGSGSVSVESNDVEVFNNTTVNGDTALQNTNIVGSVTQTGSTTVNQNIAVSGNLSVTGDLIAQSQTQFEEILFENNTITTTSTNQDLELRASGGGNIVVPSADVQILNDLSLQNLNHTGNIATGRDVEFGRADVSSVRIQDNFITTNISNADLELRAVGTGNIVLPEDNLTVNRNLSILGLATVQSIAITGSLSHTDNRTQTGNYEIAGEFTNGNIVIEDNFITTDDSNSDLELRANGTGVVSIPNNDLEITNNLDVSGIMEILDTTIVGNLVQSGDTSQTGDINHTGDTLITGDVNIDRKTSFEDIEIDGNVITTTQSNSDLELRASATGAVKFDDDVLIEENLNVGDISVGDLHINGDVGLNEFVIPPSIIEIDDNFITTRVSNADLDLRANGSGSVTFKNSTEITQDLTVNSAAQLQTVFIVGNLTHTGNYNQTGIRETQGDVSVSNTLTATDAVLSDIGFENNVIQSQYSNQDLSLSARGDVVISNNDVVIAQNLDVANLTTDDVITEDRFSSDRFEGSNIHIYDNIIETTESNSDLELRANGSGRVNIEGVLIRDNNIASLENDLVFLASGNFVVDAVGAFQLPVGSSEDRAVEAVELIDGGEAAVLFSNTIDGGDAFTVFGPTDEILNAGEAEVALTGAPGDFRFNTDDTVFEGFAEGIITFNGVYSDDRRTNVLADPTNNTLAITVNNITVATVTTSALNLHGLQVEDILFNNTEISPINSNADLELRRSGTGELIVGELSIIDGDIKNNSSDGLIFANTDNGYVKSSVSTGIVLPSGATIAQPANPQVGDTRFNTDTQILETWDGNQFIDSAGTASAITEEEFDDLILEFTLVFG